MSLRLNLGSGTSRYEDYLSVDYYVEGVDLEHDLTKSLPYADNSVDAIYSSHAVEHFSRAEWEQMRKDWARVLKPGGTIEIRTPEIYKVALQLTESVEAASKKEFDLVMTRIYGDQMQEGGYHKNGFTGETLEASFSDFTAEYLEPSTDYELHMRFTK